MRKNGLLVTTLIIVSVLFSSCQKVIHLDLSSSVPQLVIQGNVYDGAGPYAVTISKTVDFDTPNVYPAVTNATVTISDNAGQSEVLSESTDGTYVTSNMQGVIGRTYTLTVLLDGKTYTASSTMPDPVNIDSIYFKKSLLGRGTLVIDINNLPNKDNYYRVIHFVNDLQATGFSVFSENTNDVEKISFSFLPTTDTTGTSTTQKQEKGDVITVWLETIDKGVFQYFHSANSEGGQNASPANPVSNISNGALGYFSASSVRKGIIVYQ